MGGEMKSAFSKCVGRLALANNLFNVKYLLILFVMVIGLPFCAKAQEATIVGTVTDPSGAAVANAKVTLTNLETNLSKTYSTNDSGQYVAVDIHIGHYDIKVETSGFKTAEQKGLVLQVGDRARADFQLALGAAAET